MDNFLSSEKFRLEIYWSGLTYENDNECKFKNCYFFGPAVKIAQRINESDHMLLDFYSQYLHLVKSVYVAKFSWNGLRYSDDRNTVFLENAKLEHDTELNNVPQLKNSDYFVIDTKDHEVSKHSFSLVYKTYLINPDKEIYRFEK